MFAIGDGRIGEFSKISFHPDESCLLCSPWRLNKPVTGPHLYLRRIQVSREVEERWRRGLHGVISLNIYIEMGGTVLSLDLLLSALLNLKTI